jgi:Ca2+-binding RTX toxin-like protein
MYGGDGDDIYFVDNAADVVVEVDTGEETNHGGIDQIRTSLASYTLGENSFVENLAGTLSTGQTLNGNTQANVITAGAGDDTVNAGAGDDTVFGGTGNDTLNGNGGRDTINAGAGNDIVNGGNGDDTLFGNGGQDILVGGAGIDIMDGGNGNDTLDGNGGADTLLGGAGNDILRGGNGADILTGGADADTFVFDLETFGKDVVTDFTAGTDKLQFATSVFADYDTVMANSVQVGSDVVITLDAADTITLRNITVSSLHSSDMIFV